MRVVVGCWWRSIAIIVPKHGRFGPFFAYVGLTDGGSHGGSDWELFCFTILRSPPLAFVLLVNGTSLWRGGPGRGSGAISVRVEDSLDGRLGWIHVMMCSCRFHVFGRVLLSRRRPITPKFWTVHRRCLQFLKSRLSLKFSQLLPQSLESDTHLIRSLRHWPLVLLLQLQSPLFDRSSLCNLSGILSGSGSSLLLALFNLLSMTLLLTSALFLLSSSPTFNITFLIKLSLCLPLVLTTF